MAVVPGRILEAVPFVDQQTNDVPSVNIATNATVVNTANARFVNLFLCSAQSLTSITGMSAYVPFTLIVNSSGASTVLVDASPLILAGNWPAAGTTGQFSSITLVWNGTQYIELGRVVA